MPEVNVLDLDASFTPKFFEYGTEKDLPILDLKLPNEVTSLQSFLESDDGKKLKETFLEITNALMSWAIKQEIDVADLTSFQKHYYEYTAEFNDLNPHYLIFYQQALSPLAGILELIESEKISLDFRKDKIRNLFGAIHVCAEGTCTNIFDTYLELIGQCNLPARFALQRKKIAQAYILEQFRTTHYHINVGLEIHYVNAILNQFASSYGVEHIADEYIAYCNPSCLSVVSNAFKNNIKLHLTLDAIMDDIFIDPIFNLTQLISPSANIGLELKKLEEALNYFGNEPEETTFFKVPKLFVNEDEDEPYIPYQLTWDAKWVVYLSILNRLRQQEYLKPNYIKKTHLGVDIYYIQQGNLKFAYVQTSSQLPYCQPLISFLVREFCKSDDWVEWTLTQCLHHDFNKYLSQVFIIEGIIQFINSFEFKQVKNQDEPLKHLINPIIQLLPHHLWEKFFSALPPLAKKYFISIMTPQKLAILIATKEELIKVLQHIDPIDCEILLAKVPRRILFNLDYATLSDLMSYLKLIPEANRYLIIQALGIEKIIPLLEADHIFTFLSLLSFEHRRKFVGILLQHEHSFNLIRSKKELSGILELKDNEDLLNILYPDIQDILKREVREVEKFLLLFPIRFRFSVIKAMRLEQFINFIITNHCIYSTSKLLLKKHQKLIYSLTSLTIYQIFSLSDLTENKIQNVIKNCDELLRALFICPNEIRIDLINKIGNEYLHKLLLKNNTISDIIIQIQRHYFETHDKDFCLSLLFATYQAYQYRNLNYPNIPLPIFNFFRSSPIHASLTSNKLDAAFLRKDFDALLNLSLEQFKTLDNGKTGFITKTFQNYRAPFDKTRIKTNIQPKNEVAVSLSVC